MLLIVDVVSVLSSCACVCMCVCGVCGVCVYARALAVERLRPAREKERESRETFLGQKQAQARVALDGLVCARQECVRVCMCVCVCVCARKWQGEER